MKRSIIIAICVVLVTSILVVCNLPDKATDNVLSMHINSSTIRLESNMSKRLIITIYPQDADQSDYQLISENEFVALCEEDSVTAVNEGETFVYATSKDGKIQSNKVKVVVSNGIFDTAAKIIMMAENDTQNVEDELKDVKVTTEKASQIAEKEITQIPETFKTPVVTEENANEIVYVTKSGSKFHLKTCAYAKEGTPVSRSQAVNDGKTPCKKCIK